MTKDIELVTVLADFGEYIEEVIVGVGELDDNANGYFHPLDERIFFYFKNHDEVAEAYDPAWAELDGWHLVEEN